MAFFIEVVIYNEQKMDRKIYSLINSEIVKFLAKLFLVFLLVEPLTGLRAQESVPHLKIDKHQVVIANQGQKLIVSLDCPSFFLENQIVGGYSPLKRVGDIQRSEEKPLCVFYPPVKLQNGGEMEIQLFMQWSPKKNLLRKWTRYRLFNQEKPVLLKEIVLDKLDVDNQSTGLPTVPGQSYPVFGEGFFAGIEFPVSSMRKESGQIVLAHQPGIKMQPGKWYESKKAVYGTAVKGQEKEAFLSYINANRSEPDEIHVNYNSWWSSPVPYSEKEILELMKTFEQKMFLPYGVSFNSFCIDLGWSDTKSIWGIDTLMFPKGFVNIQEAAKKMNTNLGLWISPSNMYSPKSLDSDWAEQHGYETFVIDSTKKAGRLCCMAGEHYSSEFRKQLVDIVKKYEIKHLKFDGFIFTTNPTLLCNELDHGHEPGYLSIEPAAEALIETCRQIHQVSPDTWIETTCMGGDPSPWWLFYVNSVIGTYGSDYPEGRIPSPVYRESYTTSRDYFNIQGATYGITPISAQEVLGVVHQTMEPFSNDAVTSIMRGNLFLPLYINPVYMDGPRWKMIADMISWAKNNASLIRNTNVLLPVSWQNGKVPRFEKDEYAMPREPYGYAHCTDNHALIELRNPWITNGQYELAINNFTGFSPNVKNLSIVSLYPEVRVYATGLKYGDTVHIPLAPYETLVVSVSDHASLEGLPTASEMLHGFGRVAVNRLEKIVIMPDGTMNSEQPDSVKKKQATPSVIWLSMEGSVEVTSPQADLLILVEGDNIPVKLEGTLFINENPMPLIPTENQRILPRWKASKKYWVFLKAPLNNGANLISLKLELPDSSQKVSVWAWAKKPGNTALASYPNALPQPEEITIESVNLIEPFDTKTVFNK